MILSTGVFFSGDQNKVFQAVNKAKGGRVYLRRLFRIEYPINCLLMSGLGGLRSWGQILVAAQVNPAIGRCINKLSLSHSPVWAHTRQAQRYMRLSSLPYVSDAWKRQMHAGNEYLAFSGALE